MLYFLIYLLLSLVVLADWFTEPNSIFLSDALFSSELASEYLPDDTTKENLFDLSDNQLTDLSTGIENTVGQFLDLNNELISSNGCLPPSTQVRRIRTRENSECRNSVDLSSIGSDLTEGEVADYWCSANIVLGFAMIPVCNDEENRQPSGTFLMEEPGSAFYTLFKCRISKFLHFICVCFTRHNSEEL